MPYSATAQILGHLSWDAETISPNGKTLTKFRMYTADGPKDNKKFSSFEITVWGELAAWTLEGLVKGALVLATGKMKVEEYANKDGVLCSKVVINADAFNGVNVLAPPKAKTGDGVVSRPRSAAPPAAFAATDDEIPF